MRKILSLKNPQYIIKNGKLTAVIIDIKDYKEILEIAKNIHHSRELKKLRKSKLRFKPFDEFIKED